MTQHDPLVSVRHMRDHAAEAIAMLGGRTAEELHSDRMLQLALVQLIEIVGEAASRTPDDFRLQHPQVPWRLAADMRNKLIHGYDLIEYTIVHDTVKLDLPPLVELLDTIVRPNEQ
jgi:uncharacterized protein with HEPN domain